jgi:hypothetical protein
LYTWSVPKKDHELKNTLFSYCALAYRVVMVS